jgi:tRNA nucleotidyltransferase (CCA-adding enzyme)
MPDYVYLLENRLSPDQRNALAHLRDAAREAEMILFLAGDAVRDLTSGHAVRELEVAVHGNALKLKKPLEKLGAKVWGEDAESHSLYLCFPGTVRADVVSTHNIEYPKPGKAVYHSGSIQEDLRRRDFTANAMAISLNEGSFGLLMDPLNGAADIESRTLRLVSNYGFLEEPSLLIRATRYRARLGWELDPRTQARYENAKAEGVIEHLSPTARSSELEQIGHEEEGLKVLRALEEEGWMKVLCPTWTSSKADEPKLKALHELAVELLMQGVHADMSAAQMQLLTSGMNGKDLAGLKHSLLRPGFVEEWDKLDEFASGFQKVLLAKQNGTPSATYKLFMSYDPEAILWLGFTSKSAAVQERYQQFLKVWPEARQRIPYALMQEMRITHELPGFNDLVQAIFLELIDGRLTTPEEMRAYLEPHSPPAPPPQQTFKRSRKRGEPKIKEPVLDEEETEEGAGGDEDLGGDEEELELEGEEDEAEAEEGEEEEGDEEAAEREPAAKRGVKPAPPAAKQAPPPAKAEKAPAKGAVAAPAKQEPKATVPAKSAAKAPVNAQVKTPTPTPTRIQVKTPVKAEAKVPHKVPAKAATKAPVKAPAKAVAGKPVPAKTSAKAAPVSKGKPAVAKKAAPVAVKSKHGKAPGNHKIPAKHSKPAAKKPVKKH